MTSYFTRFFTEKNLDPRTYEIEHGGDTHFVDSEFVIESLIPSSSEREKAFIKSTLVKIDFANGDVHHFLEHLATCYVRANF